MNDIDITEIDKNFKIRTKNERDGLVLKNALEKPFKIYGIYHDGKQYRRLPDEIAEKVNPGVHRLSTNTAGGRVRFITDSPYVVIKAMLPHNMKLPHMALSGQSGFDMYTYENGEYNAVKTFLPPYDFVDTYDGAYDFTGGKKERFITIDFPLYNDVYDLYIGIKEGSVLKEAPEYKNSVPIVYYGSSITQGGCATRPGMCYEAILSRDYDVDHINLGFSGSGCGEQSMADYIASLDMSVFVMDYDHYYPNVEYYEKTHEPFYKTVRAAHPDIPIIFTTRPKVRLSGDELKVIEIAKATYEKAKARGENVYFVPGYELCELSGDQGMVDALHPTDLGFFSMASRLSKEFDKIFNK